MRLLKSLKVYFLSVATLLFLTACNMSEPIIYTLSYTAASNGSLAGSTTQAVTRGNNGSPVTAVPNDGYHFVKWSDDITANPRTDTNVQSSISVSAVFSQDAAAYTLSYTAGSNGSLAGVTTQTVVQGNNGSPVTAVPNDGYHFVKWSDDITANPRTDTNVQGNMGVSAEFVQDSADANPFSIDTIADANFSEYIYFESLDYLSEDKDKVYSVIPSITGTPVGRVWYSLSGLDADEFILNRKTGKVVLDYKDFEHPTDTNQDNSYEITLTATDEANNSESVSWKVRITDADEEAKVRNYMVLNGAPLVRVKAGQTYNDLGVRVVKISDEYNVSVSKKIYTDYNLDLELDAIDTNNSSDKVYHIIYSFEDAPDVSRTVIVESPSDIESLKNESNITVHANDGSSKIFDAWEKDYIQKALYYARDHDGGTVHLSKGMHYFTRQLVVYSNTTIEGELEEEEVVSGLKLRDFTVRNAWKNSATSFGNYHTLLTNGAANAKEGEDNLENRDDNREESTKNVVIKNLIMDGNRERQRSWKSAGSNNSIAMKFYSIENFEIDNVHFFNTLSDGIASEMGKNGSKNITIKNSSFRYMGHSAIYLVESNNLTIQNNTIDVLSNSGVRVMNGTDMNITDNHIFCTKNGGNYGIQISANYTGGIPIDHVNIEDNIIRHTAYAGIALYSSTVDDIIQGVHIHNNILYQNGSVVSNMPAISAKDSGSRIHEGGGIDIQYVKEIAIDHNTIFNNQGSGIRLDNVYYITDGTKEDWDKLKVLAALEKNVTITQNVIVGNRVSGYEEYSDAVAYGIEKHTLMICGDDGASACPSGTTVHTSGNILGDNSSGTASANITLDGSDSGTFSGFETIDPYFASDGSELDIREISYYYELNEKNIDFTLSGGSVDAGAFSLLIEKSKALYDSYREYFAPLSN